MNVFGKFAKGVGDVVLGNDRRGPSEEVEVEVERYLQRISDGIMREDRREAVAQLRDLLYDNVQAQAAVGNAGFPVLCGILREERGDVDMVRGALECLAIALGHPAAGGAAASALEGQRRGAMNAELFARGKENVALLLGLLEEDASPAASDFYVRYHALQLLTCCAMAGSYRLQEAVLAAPLGVNKLLDMMEDGREVIRNEAILLLLGLTRTSADLQKIAAFQGAFPRLLNTVREEGGIEGGITVQDCLDLLNNLIRGNPQTQLMFREEGHMGALVALLKIGPSNSLSRQRAANLGALLNTLLLLVAPPPPDKQDEAKEASRLANQAALAQAGAVEALLSVALGQGGSSASPIRAQVASPYPSILTHRPPFPCIPLPHLSSYLPVPFTSSAQLHFLHSPPLPLPYLSFHLPVPVTPLPPTLPSSSSFPSPPLPSPSLPLQPFYFPDLLTSSPLSSSSFHSLPFPLLKFQLPVPKFLNFRFA